MTAHKGTLWMELETRGKAAHGSCPELGRNAVHAMARVVDLLQTAYAAQLRRRRHPLLGCATVSVGAICGGTQANIVPDRCTILHGPPHACPGETEAGVRREIIGVLRRKHLTVAFVHDELPPCLPLETDPRLPAGRAFPAERRPAQAGGRALLLRRVGARARRHPQRGVRPGRHCAGAYGG